MRSRPPLPPELQAEADALFELQRDLEKQLILQFGGTIHAVLGGEPTCAASGALVRVASTIIFLMLDRLPALARATYIKSLRSELEATRKSPHSMSDDEYMEGSFEFGPFDETELRQDLVRFRQHRK
jgi:hypothetical protein